MTILRRILGRFRAVRVRQAGRLDRDAWPDDVEYQPREGS
jgi:hypothetical protein